jgi:2-polyprenyl-3-methyl-5-hydroxy-6-metoxy-1,4-benzoquinol methylase
VFDLGSYEYFEDENLALLRQAPRGARILDVGCGSGQTGVRLRERGNVVWGADSAAEVQELASERLDRFILADVTSPQAMAEALGDERFGVIVFADVLEHLPDPVATLRLYAPYLEPDGRLIVSVPNVAVWYVRLGMLLGRFDYTPTGTLDRTHLRFFTRKTLARALADAGFEVEHLDVNPGLARVMVNTLKSRMPAAKEGDRRALLDSPLYRWYLRLVHPWERRLARVLPGLLAFQYVVVARKRGPS